MTVLFFCGNVTFKYISLTVMTTNSHNWQVIMVIEENCSAYIILFWFDVGPRHRWSTNIEKIISNVKKVLFASLPGQLEVLLKSIFHQFCCIA